MPQIASQPDDLMARLLSRASSRLLVLSALADGPRYGYAIQKRIKQATGNTVAPGTLYPLLKQLQTEGVIRAAKDGQARERIWYRLTPDGQTHFKHHAAQWQAAIARMQGVVLPALRHAKNHPAEEVMAPPS